MKNILIIALLFVGAMSYGQQLAYKPKNPMFGGDTFNYQQLISSANAQNSFTDPNVEDRDRTELNQFSENLSRQLLGQLSRSLFSQQFGQGLEPGTFTLGDLSLEIFESPEGLIIEILDITTGEQTQVIVPN